MTRSTDDDDAEAWRPRQQQRLVKTIPHMRSLARTSAYARALAILTGETTRIIQDRRDGRYYVDLDIDNPEPSPFDEDSTYQLVTRVTPEGGE